jgi:hypothetical protein
MFIDPIGKANPCRILADPGFSEVEKTNTPTPLTLNGGVVTFLPIN